MVDIAAQSPSWSGGSPTQYIQAVIDANGAGTTYNLLTGRHRFQTILPKAGDTIIMEPGAILTGGEDISSGWTQDSTEWYKGSITRGRTSAFGSSNCRSGYECGELNVIVVDGKMLAWVTTRGAVDEDSAWYDSGNSRVYIGINPSGKTIEIARQPRCIWGAVNNVTLKAEYLHTFGIIEAYASDAQPNRAAVMPGRSTSWPHDPDGTGWLLEGLEIRSNAGAGHCSGTTDTIRNSRVYWNGQLGMGSICDSGDFPTVLGAEDPVIDNVECLDNGVGGWNAGWEAGNTKWQRSEGVIVNASKYILRGTHNHLSSIAPIWFDINNDGYIIRDSIIADPWKDAGRGIFLEIGWSGKVYRNILYQLVHDSENDGWAKAIIFSNSGGTASTIYDSIEVFDNILYDCGGGIGGVIQNRGSGRYGVYNIYNTDVHHNLTVFKSSGSYGWTEETGFVDWSSSYSIPGSGHTYDYNVYMADNDTDNHFRNEESGGSGDSLDWTDWKGDGFDANGVFIEFGTHPMFDPNPDKMGCF